MTSEQMAWALVAAMGGALMFFVRRHFKSNDALWKTVHHNREEHEKALVAQREATHREVKAAREEAREIHDMLQAELDEARTEFASMLERATNRFSTSMDALNGTLSTFSQSVSRLEAVVAREYATKAELENIKADLRRELDQHIDHCPAKVR